MPLYELKCPRCNRKYEVICGYEEMKRKVCRKCRCLLQKIYGNFKVIDDGTFPLTGTVDKRVGGPPIQGRKDWQNRLKAKGLVETEYPR